MICNICGLHESIVNIIKIENGNPVEMHVCKDCIETMIMEDLNVSEFFNEEINQVLANIFNLSTQDITIDDGLQCNYCNTNYSEFKKTGILGCSHCYESFNEPLNALIEGFHGSKLHKGKIPKSADEIVTLRREEAILTDELNKAIINEEYEEAAVIRDKLKENRNNS